MHILFPDSCTLPHKHGVARCFLPCFCYCAPLTHHFQVVTTYFPVSTCYITTYSCPVPALSLCYPPIYPRTPLLSATFVWGHPSIPTLSAVYYHSTTHISLHPLIVLRFPSPSLIYPPSVTHIPVRQPGGQEECFPYTCHFYSGHPPILCDIPLYSAPHYPPAP